MVHRICDAEVPAPDGRTADDLALLAVVDEAIEHVGGQINRVELRAGIRTGIETAAAVNAYLNATEPWKLAKSDPDRARVVLATALAAVGGVRVALSPYLPFSTDLLEGVFGEVESWARVEPVPGTPVDKPSPMFVKVDLAELLADEPADDA
jgi:methionyl-tRNA synthetase